MREWLLRGVVVILVIAAVVHYADIPYRALWHRQASQHAPTRAKPGERPLSVDELRAACEDEVKHNRLPHYGEQTACRRYEEASRGTLPAAPSRPPAPAAPAPAPAPATPAPEASPEQSDYADIDIDQCTRFPNGSIEYRGCRHQEAERIRRECFAKTAAMEDTTGPAHQQARREANAYCREESRYSAAD